MISALPGYSQVKNYFVQAVPALSKYIELTATREVKIRLQLSSPTNQLSLSNLQTVRSPIYYLGHSNEANVAPRFHAIKSLSEQGFWDMVEDNSELMFTPAK
jgi:hypothetical protein